MIAALFRYSFVERQAIHTSNGLLSVLVTILGQSEAEEILGMVRSSVTKQCIVKLNLLQCSSDEIKKLLLANTSEALAEGSFGLPWYVGKIGFSIVKEGDMSADPMISN